MMVFIWWWVAAGTIVVAYTTYKVFTQSDEGKARRIESDAVPSSLEDDLAGASQIFHFPLPAARFDALLGEIERQAAAKGFSFDHDGDRAHFPAWAWRGVMSILEIKSGCWWASSRNRSISRGRGSRRNSANCSDASDPS